MQLVFSNSNRFALLTFLCLSLVANLSFAQKKKRKKNNDLAQDTLLVQTNPNFKPTLEINPNAIELEKKKQKKKKRKKKVYYGIKTKVRYTKEYSKNRRNIKFRKVHVMKMPEKT